MKFIPLIKQKREKSGILQKWMAEQVGVSPSLLSRWESGNAFPRFPELYIIAKLLDCEIEQLYKIVPLLLLVPLSQGWNYF